MLSGEGMLQQQWHRSTLGTMRAQRKGGGVHLIETEADNFRRVPQERAQFCPVRSAKFQRAKEQQRALHPTSRDLALRPRPVLQDFFQSGACPFTRSAAGRKRGKAGLKLELYHTCAGLHIPQLGCVVHGPAGTAGKG